MHASLNQSNRKRLRRNECSDICRCLTRIPYSALTRRSQISSDVLHEYRTVICKRPTLSNIGSQSTNPRKSFLKNTATLGSSCPPNNITISQLLQMSGNKLHLTYISTNVITALVKKSCNKGRNNKETATKRWWVLVFIWRQRRRLKPTSDVLGVQDGRHGE